MSDAAAARRLLAERLAGLPAAVRADAVAETPDLDTSGVRRVVTTGVGSSAAHARFLAHLLAVHADLPARAVPASTPLEPSPDALLVVWSQALSPNGRLPLARLAGWAGVVVATAVRDEAALGPLRAAGARVLGYGGTDEFGTLVRVVGPFLGYLAAWRLAARAGAPRGRVLSPLDADAIVAALARAESAGAGVPPSVLDGPLALVTSGLHGDLVANLQFKLVEGTLRPPPPVWDVLHFAHGPLQQLFPHPATVVALTRADAPGEAAALARLEATLVPGRHRLIRLHATLPGALAVLDHEAQLNALLLRWLAAHPDVDQAHWPGRGFDEPLYGLARTPADVRLADRTWPEVAAGLRAGVRTAVLPLGATEQHGPHLPAAADTWIAEALADALCAEVGDALALPALPVGCSREHAEFAATLDLRVETLTAVLGDVLASLRAQGFARAFVFSAHGGNMAPLAAALPALRATAAPLVVDAFTDLDALTGALHRAAGEAGVAPEAAGHHAGEVETSILLALRPHAVRRAALAPGLAAPATGAQALFYPSLRPHAPSGVVGDPRAADAVRGRRYLAAWTALLVSAYRGAKNSSVATGTQSA
jgi:creatinine amidohydrolase